MAQKNIPSVSPEKGARRCDGVNDCDGLLRLRVLDDGGDPSNGADRPSRAETPAPGAGAASAPRAPPSVYLQSTFAADEQPAGTERLEDGVLGIEGAVRAGALVKH